VTSIQSALSAIHQCNTLRNVIKWANITCTVIDTALEIRNVILGGGTVLDVIGFLLKGVVVGFMVDGMCKTPLGIILKPMMAIFGLTSQVDQIQEAIKEKNVGMIALRFTQLICMLFGLTSQCFTGDTLVATETGLSPIEEIKAGDYVWSENTETGEKALKQVLSVSVTETTVLVHITTKNGTEINTTENHPFYVEEKGWCAAADLEAGDYLHMQDGRTEIVLKTETEQLKEAVKVYNMEIEDWHTYYVSDREVLVHNNCNVNRDMPHLENGNLKEGWIHIDARHITGNHPKGAGDLFATGTTRQQIEEAMIKVISKGNRITNPSDRIQIFQMKIKVNDVKDLVRLVVDAMDNNRVITIFPVRGGN